MRDADFTSTLSTPVVPPAVVETSETSSNDISLLLIQHCSYLSHVDEENIIKGLKLILNRESNKSFMEIQQKQN